MTTNNNHVVVVGGGLVGPLCTLFMAKRGYRVSLYEYRDDPRSTQFTQRGRSINLAVSNRARRALRKVGLEDEIFKNGTPMKGRFIHNVKGSNKSILYDPRTKQCIYSIDRNYLNQKLLDEVEKHSNVHLVFNHKLLNVDIEKGHLTFLQTKNADATIEIHGDLVIGADGAFSTLRRVMQQTPLFNFSQTYIDHGYIETCIPAKAGEKMVPNHLHIWPRREFMMIALPNRDGSWTVTLFLPFGRFKQLNSPEKLLEFFEKVFPDSVELIGKKQLIEDFFKVKPSALVSIKCSSFHIENALIIGDAAHAMVPFYGQGMNAGFEDCMIFDSVLESCDDNIPLALEKFTEKRIEDAHVICDLAMYNYLEMRDLVTRPSYLIRKAFDDMLFWLLPSIWIPLYNSVTFSEMSYQQCIKNRQWQDKVIPCVAVMFIVFLGVMITYIFSDFL